MEQKNNATKWHLAMNSGAFTGLALIVISLILYYLKISETGTASFLTFTVLVAGMYIATRRYRDKLLNGFIQYSKALSFSMMVCIFASIILAFFTYIEILYIDPSMLEKQIAIYEENLLKNGMAESQVETTMTMVRQILTPAMAAFMVIIGFTIYGFFISLITALMLKKKNDGFQSTMNEINQTPNN